MTKVWMIQRDNPNQRVIVERPEREDPTWPVVKDVYDGKLWDIPAEIALETVLDTAWSVANDCAVIRLRPEPEFNREECIADIIKMCEENPEVADRVKAFVTASEYGQRQAMAHVHAEALRTKYDPEDGQTNITKA